MKRSRPLFAFVLLSTLILLPAMPALSQESGESAAEETKEERKARLQAEKEARIEAYLQRKAEKKAEKEERRADREAGKEQEKETSKARRTAVKATEAGGGGDTGEKKARSRKARRGEGRAARRGGGRSGGKDVASLLERLRGSVLSEDPEAALYLDKMESGLYTAQDAGAFAGYLAGRGALDASATLLRDAVSLDPESTSLWYNLGSVEVLRQEYTSASKAFGRVLELDPNHARAYYGMGTVYGSTARYDEAIEAYRLALTLNPDLGDPEINPQAANNELLIPVKLLIYETKADSLGLPLEEIAVEEDGRN